MDAEEALLRLDKAMYVLGDSIRDFDPLGEDDDLREAVRAFQDFKDALREGRPVPPPAGSLLGGYVSRLPGGGER